MCCIFMIVMVIVLLVLIFIVFVCDMCVEQFLQELVNLQVVKDVGIDGSVCFYLVGQLVSVQQCLGEDVINKKINVVNKSDVEVCCWVVLLVLCVLQDGVKLCGVNVVVDIVSYYKKNEFKSSINYECYVGVIFVGVVLKGIYVKVK